MSAREELDAAFKLFGSEEFREFANSLPEDERSSEVASYAFESGVSEEDRETALATSKRRWFQLSPDDNAGFLGSNMGAKNRADIAEIDKIDFDIAEIDAGRGNQDILAREELEDRRDEIMLGLDERNVEGLEQFNKDFERYYVNGQNTSSISAAAQAEREASLPVLSHRKGTAGQAIRGVQQSVFGAAVSATATVERPIAMAIDYVAGTNLEDMLQIDELTQSKQELDAIARRYTDEGGHNPFYQELYTGSLDTMLKAYGLGKLGVTPNGMALAFGADQWSESITAGRAAGLKGVDLHGYAAMQGVMEAGFALAFNKMGMAGTEKLATKAGREEIWRGTFKGLFKDLADEQVEELATTVSQFWVDNEYGVQEATPDRLKDAMIQTVLQTTMVVGAGHLSPAMQKAAEKMRLKAVKTGMMGQGGAMDFLWSHPMAADSIMSQAEPTRKTMRDALSEEGIADTPGIDVKMNKAERKQFADALRQAKRDSMTIDEVFAEEAQQFEDDAIDQDIVAQQDAEFEAEEQAARDELDAIFDQAVEEVGQEAEEAPVEEETAPEPVGEEAVEPEPVATEEEVAVEPIAETEADVEPEVPVTPEAEFIQEHAETFDAIADRKRSVPGDRIAEVVTRAKELVAEGRYKSKKPEMVIKRALKDAWAEMKDQPAQEIAPEPEVAVEPEAVIETPDIEVEAAPVEPTHEEAVKAKVEKVQKTAEAKPEKAFKFAKPDEGIAPGSFSYSYQGEREQALAPKSPMGLPEVVSIARSLNEGKTPKVTERLFRLKKNVLGQFKAAPTGEIGIETRPDIYIGPVIGTSFVQQDQDVNDVIAEAMDDIAAAHPDLDLDNVEVRTENVKGGTKVTTYRRDPTFATRVMAHELGHMDDYVSGTEEGKKPIFKHITALKKKLGKKFMVGPIIQELKDLTQWWNPYDRDANEKYTKYRESRKELYAEAVSVLLNDPEALKKRAPVFYSVFMDQMAKNSAMRDAYNGIQNSIAAGTTGSDLTKRIRDGYDSADEKRLSAMESGTWKPSMWYHWLVSTFVDSHHVAKDLYARSKAAGSNRIDPSIAINYAKYTGAEVELMVKEYETTVFKPMRDAGISEKDMGEYALYKRVIGEKGMKAAPHGVTLDTAEGQMEAWRKSDHAKLKAMDAVWAQHFMIRQDFVMRTLRESGALDPEFMAIIENDATYATFDVAKYIDKKYGAGTAQTMGFPKRVGTHEEIANPFTATIGRDINLIRSYNWNTARRAVAEELLASGDAVEAQVKFDRNLGRMVPVPPEDENMGLVEFMVEGEKKAVYVPQLVADGFSYDMGRDNKIFAKFLSVTAAPFRAAFVGLNPGFQVFNVMKDYMRTVRNLRRGTIRNFTAEYLKAIKPAFQSVFGVPPDVVKEMMKGNMLISIANMDGMTKFDKETERLLYSVAGKGTHFQSGLFKAFHNLFMGMQGIGKAIERVPKISGYSYMKSNQEALGLTDADIAQAVRQEVGSPSFITGGNMTPISNNLFLFSNAIIQGWRTDTGVLMDRKKEVGAKMMAHTVLPKMLVWSLASGALGVALKFYGAEDDDPWMTWAKNMEMMYQNASEYDMANYTMIPLGVTPNGKTTFLRVPNDEFSRFFGGLAWKGFMSEENVDAVDRLKDITSYGGDQIPSMNPAFRNAQSMVQYLLGDNPYDYFRNKKAVPPHIFKGRMSDDPEARMASHHAFARWMHSQMGLDILYKFPYDTEEENKTWLQNTIEQPWATGNILQRFIKVTDYGTLEKEYKAQEKVDANNAALNLRLRKVMKKEDKIAKGMGLTIEEFWDRDDYWEVFSEALTAEEMEVLGKKSRYYKSLRGKQLKKKADREKRKERFK